MFQGFALVREFILGNNTTGLVSKGPGDSVNVEGGEDAALAVDAIRGQPGIFVGSITTTGTFAYPSATVAAWESFIATATVLATRTGVSNAQQTNAGVSANAVGSGAVAVAAVAAYIAVAFVGAQLQI